MNAKTKTITTIAAIMLAFCLNATERSASAMNRCHKVDGELNEISNPNGTTGTITNGGILNGTSELVFTSGILPTPDPASVSYTTDVTITTRFGQLRTGNVGFDGGIGVFSEIGRINANTSTGRFAGVTGVLFTNGMTPDGGATFRSRIRGEICFER